MYTPVDRLIELRFYVPLNIKTGYFLYVLRSQALRLLLKKLNLTQQKQTMQKQNCKKKQKPQYNIKAKPTVNFKNCSCVCA